MKNKIFKRVLAFISTLIIVISSMAVPVFAMDKGDISTVSYAWLTEFGRYETSSPSKYGEMPMFTLKKDGTPVYCMEYAVSFDGSSVTGKELRDVKEWTRLDVLARSGIIRATLYGYPNNNFGVSNRAAYAATQLVIWEYQVGYRTDATTRSTQFSNYVNRNSDVKKAYNALLDAISNHTNRCDFGTSTVDLKGLGSGSAVKITDKNGVLSQFTVTSPDSDIVVSQNGNTLSIYAKKAFSDTITLTGTKNGTASTPNNALALTGAGQVLWYGTLDDPVQFSIRVKLSAGNIKLIKTSEDNEVSGIKFRIVGDNYDKTVTTEKDGTITVENLPTGTYKITEYSADKYVAQNTQTITVNPGQTTTVSFNNKLKKFNVTVTKKDAETGSAQGDASLAGAVYGIYEDGKLIDKYTTDVNGQFITKYYICGTNWTIKEISASEGYLLDDTVYNIGADAKEYKLELNSTANEVKEQVVKGNVALIKHTDNGDTQIETPEVGATFEVYLKSAGSFANAKLSEKDVLVCDENGFAKTKDMPYGLYTVHQTNGWEGRELIDDFDVFINEDGHTYRFLINNANFKSYIKIIKKDAETGKVIPYAGAGFQIYDPDGKLVTMKFTYPEVTTIDTFYTSTDGYLITPQTLEYGKGYSLVEVQAPYGYVLDSTPIKFNVTQDNTTEENGITVIEVVRSNMAQKGIIEITKTGETFSTVKQSDNLYTPIYKENNISGAVFEIYAAEDIVTLDGTLRAKKGDLVDTVTTDKKGSAKSKELYLGKYLVIEKTAPNGLLLDKSEHLVELAYSGQEVKITSASLSVYNERQRVSVSLNKVLEQDEIYEIGMNEEILSVQFGIFANEKITAADGTAIPKDALVCLASCDENGNITFDCDLPIGFKWYVKEFATDEHYVLSDTKYEFDTAYAGQDTKLIEIKINENKPIENTMKRGSIEGVKVGEESEGLGEALIAIFPLGTTEFTEENAIMTVISSEDGSFAFVEVPYGEWLIKEICPPEGYILDDTVHHVYVTDNNLVINICIENTKIRGNLEISKTDVSTGEPLANVGFRIYDKDKNIVVEGVTDEKGICTFESLEYGEYLYQEYSCDDAYVLDENLYPFSITENGVTIKAQMTNRIKQGQLIIHKVDSKDKNLVLEGVEFTVEDMNGNIIATAKTDKTGTVIFDLPYGEYVWYESKSITDYVLDEKKHECSITDDGQVIELTVENKKIVKIVDIPETGDFNHSGFLTIAMFISCGSFVFLCGLKKRRELKNN